MNLLEGLKFIWSNPEMRKTAIKGVAAVAAILILARSGGDYVASQRELQKTEMLEEWKFTKRGINTYGRIVYYENGSEIQSL